MKEGLWLRGFLGEILGREETVTIFSDSQSALHLIKNPMFHDRTKYIDVKLHFIRDVVSRGKVVVEKIDTKHNPADALTKVLPVAKFTHSMEMIQVLDGDPGGGSHIQ